MEFLLEAGMRIGIVFAIIAIILLLLAAYLSNFFEGFRKKCWISHQVKSNCSLNDILDLNMIDGYVFGLSLNTQVEFYRTVDYVFLRDKVTGKDIYRLNDLRFDCITYDNFEPCGKYQKQFWELFKKVYYEKLNKIEMKKKQEEEALAARIEEITSGLIYEAGQQEINKAAEELLTAGSAAALSKECKKALNEIVHSAKELKNKNLARKCQNFYFPELQEFIKIATKNEGNKEIMDCCQKIILEFSQHLKTITVKNKDEQEILDAQYRRDAFQMMMQLDGLIPDMLQERKKKE